MAELQLIPLSNLAPNRNALRTVNVEDPEFLDLVESVKSVGVLTPISVTLLDDENFEEDFEIIYGHNRWMASIEAGLETINAMVVTVTDEQAKVQQIVENTQRITQNPIEVRDMVLDILANNNDYNTIDDIAKLISKKPEYLNKIFSLKKLANEQIADLVASGTISVTNAYKLAKLDPLDQEQFIDQASCMGTIEFGELADERIKEVRDARRAGGNAVALVFEPKAKFRKMDDLKAVLENGDESFKAGVAYAISLDEETVNARKSEWDNKQEAAAAKKADKDSAKEAKKAEAMKKRAEDKRVKSAQIQADLEIEAQCIEQGIKTPKQIAKEEAKAAKALEAESAEADTEEV